jgi:hypothetical protein
MEVVTQKQASIIYLILVALSIAAAVLDKYSQSGDTIWMALLAIFGNLACGALVATRDHNSLPVIIALGVVMFILDMAQILMCVLGLTDPYAAGLLAVGGIGICLGLILFAIIYNAAIVERKSSQVQKITVTAARSSPEEMKISIHAPPHVILAVQQFIDASDMTKSGSNSPIVESVRDLSDT